MYNKYNAKYALYLFMGTCKIYFLPSTYKDFIYMYCWLQEREALTKWPSTYSVSLTESMDRICSLKTMLCIIVPESHSIINHLET